MLFFGFDVVILDEIHFFISDSDFNSADTYLLWQLHAENEYIFSINGKPPTERSVATLYTKYCKKMGITQKSSHKARKTYVSSLIDGGVNINTVRESAGHASERTTLRNYTFDRSGEDEKKERFEKALAI